jgi:NTE family protein
MEARSIRLDLPQPKKRFEKTLILSGAGANITYELGAAAEIQKHADFNKVIGCSAGAIIGLAIALGWNIQDLIDIMKGFRKTRVYHGNIITAIYRAYKYGYMFKHDIRSKLISTILSKGKYDAATLYFKDLPFDLNIVATKVSTSNTVLFNKELTPNVLVVDAVMASSSISLLSPPVFIDGEKYIDGFFKGNYPLQYDEPSHSLGIFVFAPAND